MGFAFNSNLDVLYSDGSLAGDFNIIQPNGSFTNFGSGSGGNFIWDMAYDPISDVLYVWDFTIDAVATINTSSGVVTHLPSHVFGEGRHHGEWHDAGTLYLLAQGNLYTVNTGTGLPTLIGSTGLPATTVFAGLADVQTTAIPEAFTAGLIGLALAGVAAVRSGRRRTLSWTERGARG
jgi:hypothetical protein